LEREVTIADWTAPFTLWASLLKIRFENKIPNVCESFTSLVTSSRERLMPVVDCRFTCCLAMLNASLRELRAVRGAPVEVK